MDLPSCSKMLNIRAQVSLEWLSFSLIQYQTNKSALIHSYSTVHRDSITVALRNNDFLKHKAPKQCGLVRHWNLFWNWLLTDLLGACNSRAPHSSPLPQSFHYQSSTNIE